MKKLTMKNLPISERPYEKLISSGADTLTNCELLAIIIKSGTRQITAIELAQRLLIECDNDINKISKLEIQQLKKIKGIGLVKAVQIKATMELAKRIAKPNINNKIKIKSPKDVFELLRYECINETKEKIFVISLNVKLDVIKITKLASGGQTQVSINMKEVFLEPIKLEADSIILVHNHPSGDSTPSESDIEITNRIKKCSDLMGIQFLDHIVIGDGNYTSIFSKYKS